MRRAFTSGTAGIKRHSVALQIKFQVCRLKYFNILLEQHDYVGRKKKISYYL